MINKLAQRRVYIVSVASHSTHEAFNLEGVSRSPDKPFRLQNQFAPNTQEWIDPLGESGYGLRKSMESQGMLRPASSWQTHHLIPQAVWKENKTITLGGYYEKVISMGICSAEYG